MDPMRCVQLAMLMAMSFGLAVASLAQAQEGDAQRSAQAGGLEEVIVTAQRRRENLNDVPISVQAFSAQELELAKIDQPAELSQIVPGLTVTRVLGNTSPYIRGIGTTSPLTGVEPAVAFYIDGIYQPAASGNVFGFNNIESIEVLKGPQGTLYGRNATGGLINVRTRDPSRAASAEITAGYGNYETVTANLYATTGVGDRLAGDLALYYLDQGEGYGRNLTLDREFRKQREFSARSKWLLEIGDDTSLRLTVDYSDLDGDASNAATPVPRPNQGLYDDVSFYDTLEGFPSQARMESRGVAIAFDHSFNGFDFKSTSAYRYVDSYQQFSVLRDPAIPNTQQARTDNTNKTFTQEFQFTSASTAPLRWIAGIYYMDDRSLYNRPEGFSVVAATPFGEAKVVNIGSTQYLKSLSGYVDATYAFTKATNFTAGIRYTNDDRDFLGYNNPRQAVQVVSGVPTIVDLPAAQIADASKSDDEVTYRVVLDHRFNDAIMVYGSYATGFKSGGFAGNAPTNPPLEPEEVEAAEIGAKIDLGGRLRMSLAGFRYDYDSLQVTRVVGITPLPTNAGAARIEGAELEGQAALTDALQVNFGFAWLDARYTDYSDVPSFVPIPGSTQNAAGPPFDAKGRALRAAPELTFNVGGSYEVPLPSGHLIASLNYFYNDGYYWYPDERVKQDAFGVLNARVAWRSPDDRYGVALWGRNLTDEKYFIACRCAETAGDGGTVGPPLTYGMELSIRF